MKCYSQPHQQPQHQRQHQQLYHPQQQQYPHLQQQQSIGLPAYHGIGSAQISAADVVSYARVGVSQGTPITTFSQPTNSYSSPFEDVPADGGRSQARFHEFIARSRHLELLELLHDMKKRITYMEEISVTNNNNIKDSLKETKTHLEKETTRIMNLTIQANTAHNNIIGELRNKLDNFQINFERLERRLERVESSMNKVNENSEILIQRFHEEEQEPEQEIEGITLEQYLEQGRQKAATKGNRRGRKSKKTQAVIPIITNNWTLEDDIFLGDDSDMIPTTDFFPINTHLIPAPLLSNLNDNDSDVTELDSYMTPPIHWV